MRSKEPEARPAKSFSSLRIGELLLPADHRVVGRSPRRRVAPSLRRPFVESPTSLNLPSIVTLGQSPTLNHHDVTVRLQAHADFVSSMRSPVFAARQYVNHFSVPNHACKSS